MSVLKKETEQKAGDGAILQDADKEIPQEL